MIYTRDDGTFVIDLNGLPYHITADDPIFPAVEARIAAGEETGTEPPPAGYTYEENGALRALTIDELVERGDMTADDALAMRRATILEKLGALDLQISRSAENLIDAGVYTTASARELEAKKQKEELRAQLAALK